MQSLRGVAGPLGTGLICNENTFQSNPTLQSGAGEPWQTKATTNDLIWPESCQDLGLGSRS